MNSAKYYKSSSVQVLKALRELSTATSSMHTEATKVCSKFDARPVISRCIQGLTFRGMHLSNYGSREDSHLWTKPDNRFWFLSRPRSRLAGFNEELKALKLEVSEAMSGAVRWVSKDDFYQSVGTGWEDLIFYGRLTAFEHEGIAYLKSVKALKNCIEITGAEYQQAEKQKQREQPAQQENPVASAL